MKLVGSACRIGFPPGITSSALIPRRHAYDWCLEPIVNDIRRSSIYTSMKLNHQWEVV
jgi:hypothetical protein